MARTSEQRNRSIAGPSRESKISALVQLGFSNPEIMAALEKSHPEYIDNEDPRRIANNKANEKHKKQGKSVTVWAPFDKTARQRALEAIRSTRKQDSDKEETLTRIIDLGGGEGEVKPLAQSPLENLRRFHTGTPAFDDIYGKTEFIHLTDEPLGRWRKGDPMIPDGKGGYATTRYDTGRTETLILKSGEKPVTRPLLALVPDLDRSKQLQEQGMPESFASIWAGSPGVGKSRLAIGLTKSINFQERLLVAANGGEPRKALYFNGEAPEGQFRQWAGGDVDPELFLAYHTLSANGPSSQLVRLDTIVRAIEKYKPRFVVIDSIQMIAETRKGARSAEAVVARLNEIKCDPNMGRPHIVLISQLNKQDEVAGSRILEHLVDFVGKATQYMGREGMFKFECDEKNRGGPTPAGAIFRHSSTGPECVSKGRRLKNDLLHLIRPIEPVPVPSVLGAASDPSLGRLQGV